MFSNLRTGSQLFILHKGASPHVETGQVLSVTSAVPRYPVTTFSKPQEMVVDVTVKVGESNVILQKLPANQDIADQCTTDGGVTITTSREAMNGEVEMLRQRSRSVLESVDYHRKVVADCEEILQKLNPEMAEQKQQKAELDALKTQMAELMSGMRTLMSRIGEGTIEAE